MTTVLEAKNVTKAFGPLVAVDKVSLTLTKGETVGIIGPNGAGKTTFFNLISGMFPPDGGNIKFKGENITHLPAYQRVEKGIARTFQLVSVLEGLSVFENVFLSTIRFDKAFKNRFAFFTKDRKAYSDLTQKVLNTLHRVNLEELSDTKVANLAYGNKRKLEIAIALSQNPELLLLDEPFAGLSDVEIPELLNLIEELKGKLTILIIEHKISFITSVVDRMCVMHEGRIISEGKPLKVLEEENVKKVYWGN